MKKCYSGARAVGIFVSALYGAKIKTQASGFISKRTSPILTVSCCQHSHEEDHQGMDRCIEEHFPEDSGVKLDRALCDGIELRVFQHARTAADSLK